MQHTLFNCTAHYPWLRVSTHVETARWRIALPSASRVVSIATAGQGGIRPAAVRIAGDRRVLFRHVDSSIVLLLSVDHSHVAHATLVDNDGVLRVFRHVGCTPLAAARGDSWFAYVCWRSDVAASEMVILDLYSGAASTVWSSDQTREVRVVRSVRLLQVKVVALHVADSARGITDPGIVMHLADGRVAVVGKRFLDARSPHKMNAAYEAEFLPPYMPVVELKGASRMVQFLGGGSRQVLVSGIEAAGVWEQESSCVVVVAGVDMLLEKVQTQGNFDALPADFGRWAVIVMVLGLMFVFWYSKNERTKASLLRAW